MVHRRIFDIKLPRIPFALNNLLFVNCLKEAQFLFSSFPIGIGKELPLGIY